MYEEVRNRSHSELWRVSCRDVDESQVKALGWRAITLLKHWPPLMPQKRAIPPIRMFGKRSCVLCCMQTHRRHRTGFWKTVDGVRRTEAGSGPSERTKWCRGLVRIRRHIFDITTVGGFDWSVSETSGPLLAY